MQIDGYDGPMPITTALHYFSFSALRQKFEFSKYFQFFAGVDRHSAAALRATSCRFLSKRAARQVMYCLSASLPCCT